MALSKRRLFSDQTLLYSDISKSVAQPTRFFILKYLQRHGAVTNSTLQHLTNSCRSTISQHLREMEKMKLINSEFDEFGKSELTVECDKILKSYGKELTRVWTDEELQVCPK